MLPFLPGSRLRQRSPTLDNRLTWLVLGALLPFVPLLGGIVVADYRAARASAAQQILEVARGTALAVGRELRATIASLEALATSPSLARDDLDAFRREVETLGKRHFPGASIALLDLHGQQFFNTFKPPGTKLPRRPNVDSLERVKSSGQPAVSDIFMATLQQKFIVPVDVPVFGPDGQVRAILSLAPPLRTFAEAIVQQRPEPGWVVSVLDRQGVVVARMPDADRFVGQPALQAFRRLLAQQAEGIADVVALDGTHLLAAWSRPEPFGWSVAIGIPHAQFYAAQRRAVAVALAVFVPTMLGALLLARIVARRIARPVHALARLAAQPATADVATTEGPRLGLHEADSVAAALLTATRERQAAEARLRDVEARNRAELERQINERTQELRAAQTQLLASQRMEAVGQLTAGVAHDFNNLLQAQIGALELLLDAVHGQERATRFAAMALASAEHGARLTHSLLSFSRQQVLRPEAVDVAALLERLAGLLSRTLDPRIALRVDVEAGIASPMADPAQLEAALLNLSLNARDAMEDCIGQLRITACSGDAPGTDPPEELAAARYVVFVVADEGCGMDAATLGRICEPFFTTKGPSRGSGLGLSMVQGFARQSGGELRIRSTPGQGTRCEIWLPEAAAADAPAGSPRADDFRSYGEMSLVGDAAPAPP